MINVIKFHSWLSATLKEVDMQSWPTADLLYELLEEAIAADLRDENLALEDGSFLEKIKPLVT